MNKVFIDGQSGTTGLQIVERLQGHQSIEIMEIPEKLRKNPETKKKYLNEADVVILCLPDQAARDSVGLITDSRVKVLDASTAHRTMAGWVYGLPELNKEQRSQIKQSHRISVPGCYPTGFVLAIAPLVRSGAIPADYPVSIQAVSGYSGGGRQLIEKYEEKETSSPVKGLNIFRPYGLHLDHKHLPEMKKFAGLERSPLFMPSVGHFYQGMLVMVPISLSILKQEVSGQSLIDILLETYRDEKFVRVLPFNHEDQLDQGFLSPTECNGTNRVDLMIYGHEDQLVIISRLDNLGKGASGAAVQNLNLMLGLDEESGLEC